jgi:hypothetical protein
MKTMIKLVLVGLAARWVIARMRERSSAPSVPTGTSAPA